MFSKARTWMGIGKPKNQHSLENLKYLYGVLNKNQTVTENNKDLLIETLRSISEILIWGDQNDSSVFDFFLEKQMITFFLHYMKQKYGRFICVQLLQTLNILFENIRHETSLYFLLSNNHINNIILNKFDFSDEEVMAYYISFLKTLSLKLNTHSIHFFFNERASEFPLYVEAIKFFDHPESMVRIAVRTLTLNIYRVPVQSMQKFVKEKTALFYFSNLVWLMRNHVLDLDICVKNTVDHTRKSRLIDLIDEYIDHLNYLQDIYTINNEGLANILTEQLVRRLIVPVYLSSLLKRDRFVKDRKPYIQPLLALFLMSHLFLVINHMPLMTDICEFLFNLSDEKIVDELCFQKVRSDSISHPETDYLSEPRSLVNCLTSVSKSSPKSTKKNKSSRSKSMPHFPSNKSSSKSLGDQETAASVEEREPEEPTDEEANENAADAESKSNAEESAPSNGLLLDLGGQNSTDASAAATTPTFSLDDKAILPLSDDKSSNSTDIDNPSNITDDEKTFRQSSSSSSAYSSLFASSNALKSSMSEKGCQGIIFDSLLQFLTNQEYNELNSLLALSFLYTLINNAGVTNKYLEIIQVKVNKQIDSGCNFNELLTNKLISIISKAVEPDFKVRLATLELAIKLIKSISIIGGRSYINDFHLACIEQAREQSAFLLRRQFKTEEMFLDMFEHEYQSLNSQTLNLEFLLRDWSILLTPTSTPLSGIEFTHRFPCGDTEKLKQTIRIFFLLRDLCLNLTNETENQLPLTKQEYLVKENDALDLNCSDLIACTVNIKEKKDRRFLVIDPIQFILVEPEVKRIGWGIVKLSDLIQDVEVTPEKDDSRSLNITIKKSSLTTNGKPEIILNSIFTFDDHIRCMAAKQHLMRSRDRARRMKLEKIAQLLDISSASSQSSSSMLNSSTGSAGATSKTYMSQSSSNSNILSYNLVAGLNMLGTINHPGRASMISQTWSQLAGSEKANPSLMPQSPMAALTSSPMVRNTSSSIMSSSSAAGSFYRPHMPVQHLFSSPSLVSSTSSASNNDSSVMSATSGPLKSSPQRQQSLSPYETAVDSLALSSNVSADDLFGGSGKFKSSNQEGGLVDRSPSKDRIGSTTSSNLDANFMNDRIEKKRSSVSSATEGLAKQPVLVKTLVANTDQSVSLIATSLNSTDSELAAKLQILPPAPAVERTPGLVSHPNSSPASPLSPLSLFAPNDAAANLSGFSKEKTDSGVY